MSFLDSDNQRVRRCYLSTHLPLRILPIFSMNSPTQQIGYQNIGGKILKSAELKDYIYAPVQVL